MEEQKEDGQYTESRKDGCRFIGTRLVSVNKLKPSKYQTRQDDLDDIEGLAESIRSIGLIENPSVRVSRENGQTCFEIITGHRRIRAVSQCLGWKEIKCKVYENMDEFTAFCLALSENVHRSNLSQYEEGLSYLMCQRIFGLSDLQVAERLHRSSATVVSRKQLAKSAGDYVQYLKGRESGTFLRNYTFGHHEVLARISDPYILEWAVKLISEGVTVRELKSCLMKQQAPRSEGRRTSLSSRARSNRTVLLNQLKTEVEHLKEDAPEGFRSRIYRIEDIVDSIFSKGRCSGGDIPGLSQSRAESLRDVEHTLSTRVVACPGCGRSLQVERRLSDGADSVLFRICVSDNESAGIQMFVFPRIQ